MKNNHPFAPALRIASYYATKVQKSVFGQPTLASDTEQVDPGITLEQVQPFHLQSNLENVSQASVDQWGDRSRSTIESRLQSRNVTLAPYVVRHVRDAAVIDGSVYSRFDRHVIDAAAPRLSLSFTEVYELPEAALAHTYFSSIYWGHWVSFEIPTRLELGQRAPLISYKKIPKFKDEVPWNKLLNLPALHLGNSFVVGHLQLAEGTSESITCVRQHRRIRKTLNTNSAVEGKRIYLRRPPGGSARELSNEGALIEALRLENFHIVDPGTTPVDELVKLCAGAQDIVGIEGSHLIATMYLAAQDGLITVLQPPGRVTFNHNDSCHFVGVATAMYVCRSESPDGNRFGIDIPDFLRFLEKARSWSHNSQQRLADYSGAICASR